MPGKDLAVWLFCNSMPEKDLAVWLSVAPSLQTTWLSGCFPFLERIWSLSVRLAVCLSVWPSVCFQLHGKGFGLCA